MIKEELPYFVVMFDDVSGLAQVFRTNIMRPQENYFADKYFAVHYTKELMDNWLTDKMEEQMLKYRENQNV